MSQLPSQIQSFDHAIEFKEDSLGSIDMEVFWRKEPMHQQSFGSVDEVSDWLEAEFFTELREFYDEVEAVQVEKEIRDAL